MDSPHLTGLCFLLLAVAAPCPNIAMPSGHPAERTHDPSSGKTKQGNTFSEGIYGIVWVKARGFGHSCAILNSTAFSANGRGSISPEENKLCCEAETNIWESNLTLKCHTEMSGAETRKAPAGILGEEIPGRRSNIVISVTFLLFLVLCAGMVSMYCYRQHRNTQALQLLITQRGFR